MVERTMATAADAMNGELVSGAPEVVFRGAAIDSRKTSGGALFFALPGERVDGHAYAAAALALGAAGVVVHRDPEPPVPPAAPCVRVADTFEALHALTRAVRRVVPRKLVGVTGSMGKTTTKELLAAMLGQAFSTAKSPGNLNNTYGFPVALLGIPDDTEWMVAEMGMSTPGELRAVSRLGRPDVAVFTNVRAAHLANFGTVEAIADAKAELLAGVPDDGLVVANADDPLVMRIASRHPGPVVRYGVDRDDVDVWITPPQPRTHGIGSTFVLHAGNEQVGVTMTLHGLYNAENALAAAACAYHLGVSLPAIATALAEVDESGPMRGQVERTPSGARIINDAYNANPAAVARALESAAALPGARRTAVLGDMLELGPEAETFHRQVGEQAAALAFDRLVGVGPASRATVAAARANGVEGTWFETTDEAVAWATSTELDDTDLVLVKGSRGMALEAVVAALCAAQPAPSTAGGAA